MSTIFGLIDKLFRALFLFPPLYIAYRFLRWYLKQDDENGGS